MAKPKEPPALAAAIAPVIGYLVIPAILLAPGRGFALHAVGLIEFASQTVA